MPFEIFEILPVDFIGRPSAIISSRRHRGGDGGSYGFRLRPVFTSFFAYNFVRK